MTQWDSRGCYSLGEAEGKNIAHESNVRHPLFEAVSKSQQVQ